jgi:hypothetical protein
MGVTDPVVARRERRRRFEGRPALRVSAIGAAALAVVCAAALGVAVGELAEDFRHSVIDSVFDDRESGPTFWGAGTLAYLWMLGTFGLLASTALANWSVRAYRGGERPPVVLVPVLFAVVAAVVTEGATKWLQPLDVGTRVDPVFHKDVPWNAGAWVAYAADVWFPVVVIIVAAAVIVGAVLHNRQLRAQRMLRTRLLKDGRQAPGTMTHVTPRTATNDVGQRSVIGATVDVRFTDDDGVERLVSRYTTERTLTPGMGGVEVLYDPLDPADERSIFIAFVSDPLPSEWVGPLA